MKVTLGNAQTQNIAQEISQVTNVIFPLRVQALVDISFPGSRFMHYLMLDQYIGLLHPHPRKVQQIV